MYFLVARSLSPTDPYFVSTTDQPADLVGQRFERGRGDTGDWTPVSESIIFALDVSRVPPQSQTTAPTSAARILRIEPEVRDIRLRPGDEILLAIRVYGRQNIRDDSLADERPVSWDSDGAGRFSGDTDGIVVAFRAPVVSGNYEIKATASGCYPKQSDETEVEAEARCTAVFTMRVLRDRGSVVETPEPRNPAGNIPVVIPGADGTQHAVFTPKEGGSAVGGSCTFEAPPGAVEDLEYIGIAAEETDAEHGSEFVDPRFVVGETRCRFSTVDSTGAPVSAYRMRAPGDVCLPLPDQFRGAAFDAQIIALKSDGETQIINTRVRIAGTDRSLRVCGKTSEIPLEVAVAIPAGPASDVSPTPTVEHEIAAPDTGPFQSPSAGLLVFVLILGAALATIALAVRRPFIRPRE